MLDEFIGPFLQSAVIDLLKYLWIVVYLHLIISNYQYYIYNFDKVYVNLEPFIYKWLNEKLLNMAYLYLGFIIQFQLPYISWPQGHVRAR